MTPDQRSILRRLALHHPETVTQIMSGQQGHSLDASTTSLIQLSALICIDSEPIAFRALIDEAVAAGVSDQEVVDTLIAVAPIVGTARLSSSLAALMVALDEDPLSD